MALPILDGNQTAATLSTIITGGAHIPAHTVVSLGSQAISDITSGVSGSVVSISNFPSTQTVAGTVTVGNFPATQTIAGTVTANVNFSAYLSGPDVPAPSQGIALGYLTDSQTFFAPVHEDQGLPVRIQGQSATQPISGTVTVGGFSTVSVGSGALMIGGRRSGSVEPLQLDTASGYLQTKVESLPAISGTVTVGNSVTISSLPAISGTVTANVFGFDDQGSTYQPIPVGLATDGFATNQHAVRALIGSESGSINSGNPLPISGTVTIGALPSGSLTTRFGSVTTANTAQITSAVTNTSRKYLLAQNISAGTVTIGIGFSPTTTQGIQLTAGGGLTFDAFCPTGAVYWLGAVTGAAFTILEG